MEGNYLMVGEYEEKISSSKSSIYQDFIQFQHSNDKFYFAWVKNEKIFMRSEGYSTASERDQGILSILQNRSDKNNYRTDSANGFHFLYIVTGNNKEIARSCPYKEEIETFIALNQIDESDVFIAPEMDANKEIEEERILLQEENSSQSESKPEPVTESTQEANLKLDNAILVKTENIEEISSIEKNESDKIKLISSPLLDSFKSEVKSENNTSIENNVVVLNTEEIIAESIDENRSSITEIEVSNHKSKVELDYFDEDKQVNITPIEIEPEVFKSKSSEKEIFETKLGSILAEDDKATSKGGWKWLLMFILFALLGVLFWWLLKMDGYHKLQNMIPTNYVAVDTLSTTSQAGIKPNDATLDRASIEAKATWEKTLGGMVAIRLPDGSILNVPENGTEKRLVEYLEAKCGTSELKKTWFDMDRILFQSGTDKLKEISDEQIILLAKIFKSYPNKKFKIGGYTDNVGNPEANIRLSAIRAAAATRAIASKGIDSTRMRYEGYGQEHPICPTNDTEECRAKNRRVAIRVDVCE
jgi:outer membrane protein OmpA-like peptidoglycan-associated protein/uncharacterized protein YegP (UPF0339 family)